MRPQEIIVFILSLLFAPVAGEGRIAIDRHSCTDDDVFPHVRSALNTAMRWARETADELDHPISEMDSRIVEKARWLLGHDDSQIEIGRIPMQNAFSRIGTLELVDVDVYADEWKQTQSKGDITIVCNGDYLEHVPSGDFPDFPYRNVLRDEWVRDDDVEVRIKKGKDQKTLMLTTLPSIDYPNPSENEKNKADIILIHPATIKAQKKGGWSRLTEERVQKAVNPDFLQSLQNKAQGFGDKFLNILKIDDRTHFAPVQLLDTFESTMLHELTHTRQGHGSRDLPEGACYGWVNAVECKNYNNADNLMWLALSFQLIRHHGYDVTEEGKLKRI